jgi:hypothetical protein
MVADPRDASRRARRAIEAAETLHDRAPAIAQVCMKAASDQLVVAVVEEDGTFGGAWPVALSEVAARLDPLEAGGWTLTFAAQTPEEEIRARALEMARLAFRRWLALRRWVARHPM